jgi:hypothetical protein
MSDTTAPGGISLKEFKLYATETGQWLWGTAQGAFNEKQTLSQIITDAVIGMIPVVGDVTAARDIIAISMGLATEPAKREKPSEWLLLVIFIFALIPVFGGVIKGVGRLTIRVTENIAQHAPEIAKLAGEVIALLNRFGHKNAEAWLKSLDVLKYEAEILSKFRTLCDTVILSIDRYIISFKAVLPQSLVARAQQISEGFKAIKVLGDKMIPQALKDFHAKLDIIKKAIHAGGVPPVDKTATITAQTGQKTVSYVEEARAIENGAAKRIARGGKHPQNLAPADQTVAAREEIAKVYKKEDGFPDLTSRTETVGAVSYYPAVAAAKGPIKNEMLSGETLFRAFGPEGTTHGVNVGKSYPIGMFWGRGAPPKTAQEWRQKYAVLDEWNRNGWLSTMHIPADVKLPACTSTVSEQFSKGISGQFLEGGGKQAAIDSRSIMMAEVDAAAQKLYAKGGGKTTLPNGITIEVKQSGWSGINGKEGYVDTVIPGASMTERLGVTEIQGKVAQEGVKQTVQASGQTGAAAAKDQRASDKRPTGK